MDGAEGAAGAGRRRRRAGDAQCHPTLMHQSLRHVSLPGRGARTWGYPETQSWIRAGVPSTGLDTLQNTSPKINKSEDSERYGGAECGIPTRQTRYVSRKATMMYSVPEALKARK